MIQNPIIKGCNPDPSILRIGDDYYIATSTFEWSPGISIYHSRDLQSWKQIGFALTKKNNIDLNGIPTAKGIWAPCLTYSNEYNKCYILYSFVYNIQGNYFDLDNFMIEADSIDGVWSAPIYINSCGFDPSLYHEDGRQWITNLVWEHRDNYEHPGYISLQEWDVVNKKLIGSPKIISNGGTNRGCLEAPHLYKRGGYYYLMTAEGGTGYGHAVVIQRSRDIYGPYEIDPKGVVITSQPKEFNERGIDDCYKLHLANYDSILQKSGHGSLVETQNGELYIVHLCSRPFMPELRSFLGREVSIQKCIETEDGWIRLKSGDNLAELTTEKPSFLVDTINPISNSSETVFVSNRLPLEFQTYRGFADDSWLQFKEGKGLGIVGKGSLFNTRDTSLVARKVQSFDCDILTRVEFSPDNLHQSAGLAIFYSAFNFYYLRVYKSQSLNCRALGVMVGELGSKKELTEFRVILPSQGNIFLKAEIRYRELQFMYSLDGNVWVKVGEVLDTTILADEYGDQKFTGTFCGIFCEDLFTKKKTAYFNMFAYIENS